MNESESLKQAYEQLYGADERSALEQAASGWPASSQALPSLTDGRREMQRLVR
ncbi:MAG: hypothetical protein AB7S38_36920 [Vulcanimicrobiota bacterium]